MCSFIDELANCVFISKQASPLEWRLVQPLIHNDFQFLSCHFLFHFSSIFIFIFILNSLIFLLLFLRFFWSSYLLSRLIGLLIGLYFIYLDFLVLNSQALLGVVLAIDFIP